MTTERLRKGLTKKFSQNVMLWQVDVKLAGLRQEKLEIYIANSAILISCEGWTKSHLPSRSNCTSTPFEPTRSAGFSFALSAPQTTTTTDITVAALGGDLMARKNNRKHYHSRWLSDDLYKLTKKNKVSVAASISPTPTTSVAPKATHQNITPLREKDTPMETHTPAATPAALSPRPAKPQGMDDPRITRGSVWFADLAPRTTSNLITSVQSGTRPVLVISNDLNNRFGTVITIIPFTGAPKRLDMPTHVAVIPSDVRNGYMPSEIYESTLLCEQITALDKSRLVSYVGSVVNPDLMNRVEQALLTQIGITSHSTNNSPSEEVRNHVQS